MTSKRLLLLSFLARALSVPPPVQWVVRSISRADLIAFSSRFSHFIFSIASFARMQKLTTDLQTVVEALRSSPKLKLNDDSSCVTRVDPLPQVVDLSPRSVFVSGLPSDSSIETVGAFFNGLLNASAEEPAVTCVRVFAKRVGPGAAVSADAASTPVTYDCSASVEFTTEDQAKQIMSQSQYKFTTVGEEDKMITVAPKSVVGVFGTRPLIIISSQE